MQWWVLRKRMHVSWLIAALCAGVVVGVIAAQYVEVGWTTTAPWLIAGLVLIAICLMRGAMYMFVIIAIAGCMIGLWREVVLVSKSCFRTSR